MAANSHHPGWCADEPAASRGIHGRCLPVWHQLGVRNTRETLGDVLVVLQRLVSGRIQRTSLGGPIKIAAVGTAESSQGLPRLLVFLAYVGINYAVFCCLPIPGLDGGHLLFLAIEGIRRKPVGRTVQLLLIVISLVGFLFVLCAVVVPCLSQLLRLIGLIRVKKAARSDGL
ncbi:MAG: site-2 protease family protein [Planctomycetes bacterium]|nr:site-2 protease family protein [Planctomycetota bacterium]